MADLDPNVDWAGIDALLNQIRTLYPNMAWMLNVPELADVLIRGGLEKWDDGRITAAIQATQWWKDRNATSRRFEELLNSDPATAEQQVSALKVQIQQFAAKNGMQISEPEAIYIARESLVKGRTDQEWQGNVLDFLMGNKGQASAPIGNRLKALAAQYAVPMSDATLQKWERDILSGMVDEQTFTAYLVEQAKSLFPGLANALDRGITVDQYVAPYREIITQELGLNPAAVDWRDPKWGSLLQKSDGKGGVSTLTTWDAIREIRSNPIYGWDRTQGAQEQATSLGRALQEKFGRAA